MTATLGGPAAPCSADRRRILDAALGPEPVEASANAQLGAGADIAFERLTVVADVLDDAHEPVLGEPELFAVIALDADQPPDFRQVRLERFVDGLRRHAELLRIDHAEVN